MAIVLGIISTVIAILAFWIAVQSDRKMRAIANLEFDEKATVLQGFANALSTPNIRDLFMGNVEAVVQVSQWADNDKRRSVANLINQAAGNNAIPFSANDRQRLQLLARRISP